MSDLQTIQSFLKCPTPDAWIQAALENPETLLIDHANCEKKAASTALNLLHRYPEHYAMQHKLSRLAREELRHFEQVVTLMHKKGIEYRFLTASRYASSLHKHARKSEPHRLVDALIIGSIIEARSCERFAALAPHLELELQVFYLSLLKSESRHFQDYLRLAEILIEEKLNQRLGFFLELEAGLIQSPDEEFRFHSGIPVAQRCE